ncbi:MAG: hypothetical protein SFZ03_09835 [Candidatus Melainabacteria bacterium]|nr:hypothetical protein [Candidatus Melainabacteria bacterium]
MSAMVQQANLFSTTVSVYRVSRQPGNWQGLIRTGVFRHAIAFAATILLSLPGVNCLPPSWAETAKPTPAQELQTANQLAGQKQYPQAIALYEKLLQQAQQAAQQTAPKATQPPPSQAAAIQANIGSLKRNLAVLYFNQALQLQKSGAFADSRRWLEKSKTMDPSHAGDVQRAIAGSYLQEAAQLRDSGSKDYAAMRTLAETGKALAPQEKSFNQLLASLLMSEAADLADAEQTETAIARIEQAKALQPDEPVIQHSLANLCLAQAHRSPDEATMNTWIEKALKADNSPDIQQQADRIRENRAAASKTHRGAAGLVGRITGKSTANESMASEHAFLKSTQVGGLSRKPIENTASAKPSSTFDQLRAVEKALNVTPAIGSTVVQRLSEAETAFYGESKTGAVQDRASALFDAVLGQTALNNNAEALGLMASTASNAEGYLPAVLDVTGGRVARWVRFPIRVYVEAPKAKTAGDSGDKKPDANKSETQASVKDLYQPFYSEAVEAALKTWQTATQGYVSYVLVKNKEASDIRFVWASQTPPDPYVGEPLESLRSFYSHYEPPKRTKLGTALGVASMFTPGYFAIIPQVANAALQYRQMQGMQSLLDESTITLGLASLHGLPEETARIRLHNQAARFYGHALGLKSISPHADDLLHPSALKADALRQPTENDLATLRQLYSRAPDVVLNVVR